MFKNSSELLDYALRELQVAVENNNPKVEIVLKETFSGDINDIKKFSETLEIKTITEILREEFSNYDIKSIVAKKGLSGVITFSDSPCALFYTLTWELTLRKKEVS